MKRYIFALLVVGMFYAPQGELQAKITDSVRAIHSLEMIMLDHTLKFLETKKLLSECREELHKVTKSKEEGYLEIAELESTLALEERMLKVNSSALELQKKLKESLHSQQAESRARDLLNIKVDPKFVNDLPYAKMAMSAVKFDHYAEFKNGMLSAHYPSGNLIFSLNLSGLESAKLSLNYLKECGVSLLYINKVCTRIDSITQQDLLDLYFKLSKHLFYNLEAAEAGFSGDAACYNLTLTPIHLPPAADESLKHIGDGILLTPILDEEKEIVTFLAGGKFMFGLSLHKAALKHSLEILPIKITSLKTDLEWGKPHTFELLRGMLMELRAYSEYWKGSLRLSGQSEDSYHLDLILKKSKV